MGDLDLFSGGGQFLSKVDVVHPVVATIASTGIHTFPGESRPKLVLNWQTPGLKAMACNATNVQVLRTLFGVTDTTQLVGKVVEIFNDLTVRNPSGQIVGGLRLRAPSQQPQFQQQLAPQQYPQPPAQGQQPQPADKAPWE